MSFRPPARASRRRVPALTNDPSPLFQPPEAVGPYRVRRVLASGTLGPRLLVEDDRGRLQVLKLITEVPDDGEALLGVLEHVRKSLPAHPGLLAVSEIGTSPEGVYLASPVLNAQDVEGRLRGGRQTLEATLAWLRGVTAGLQAAHEAGVWHGAIHPRDVLVGDDGGVLTGVGVAPALEHLALQAPVRVPYTAPERASGQRWDARADQYSLAMLALDALSGRRLIAGTIPAFDRWTLAETPAEDARLHEVFVRALHPDPAQRFESLADWLEALAGSSDASQDGALSRFAREGVILASPAAVAAEASRESAGRDIEVQQLEDPEGVALSLFPEEDGTAESPVVERPVVVPAVPPVDPEVEQEWLVADVPPDEAVRPTDSFGLRQDSPPSPVVPSADPAPEWRLDDRDGEAPGHVWEEPADESPRRGVWLLLVAALVLAAIGYGTWRSLQAPATGTGGEITAAPDPPDSAPRDDADAQPPGTAQQVTRDAVPQRDPVPQRAPAPQRAPVPQRAPAPSPRSPGGAPTARAVPQAPVPPRQPRQTPAPPAPAGTTASPAASADAAADGTGRVLIRSSPAGEVRVNGRSHGETPVVLRDLPFGSYVISVSRDGFAPVERRVDLLPSQPVASLTVDLARQGAEVTQAQTRPAAPAAPPPAPPASPVSPPTGAGAAPAPGASPASAAGGLVVVSTPARARLYVDGRLYGSTPASIPGLSPGAHVLRIEADGYRPWQGQVNVVEGTRTRVEATLQREQE